MDRKSIAATIFTLALSTAAAASEPAVMVNASHLQPSVRAEVEKHAAQGMTSLRRYLESTRKQHGLWIDDVTRMPDGREMVTINDPNKEYKKHAKDWKPQQ
jgi:hypothetical protein